METSEQTSSTPWRDSGVTSDTTASGAVDIDQKELQKRLYVTLRGHTWQFPPHDIARMLSPKLVKEEHRRNVLERPLLDHYDILIEHPVVKDIMREEFRVPPTPPTFVKDEKANYDDVAEFLNQCIGKCNNAYEEIYKRQEEVLPFVIKPRAQRWLRNLRFLKNDKPTGDTVKGASTPIKPDLIAVDCVTLPNPPSETVGYWNLPDNMQKDRNSKGRQIKFTGDLKLRSWKRLVLQCGTYGRGEFTNSPLCVFTIVFGIDHDEKVMRILIFHHGGLTASHEISLDKVARGKTPKALLEHRRDLLKIFLSILLWQGPVDAGYPEYTNGESWIVPSGKNDTVIVKQKAILYYQPLIRSRETFVVVLSNQQPQTDSPAPPVANEPEKRERKTASMTLRSLSSTSKPPVEQPAENHPTVHRTWKQHGEKLAFFDDVSTRDKRNYGIFPSGDSIGKASWPGLSRRGIEANMYRACNGDYGTPEFISSFEPLTSRGDPYSNSIFLPPPGSDLKSYYWNIAEKDPKSQMATVVDVRIKNITLIKTIGSSLEYCVSSWDLCECLLHSMLGWLSVYQSGYLQRDVSIGNVLRLKEPVAMKPFSIQKFLDFRDAMFSKESQENNRREIFDRVTMLKDLQISEGARFKQYIEDVIQVGLELERKVAGLGITATCKAVIADGDLAAYLPTYFGNEHELGQLSGTFEFMSPGLWQAVKTRDRYLHKPIDDIFSYYWLTLWNTVLLPAAQGDTKQEGMWRQDIRNNRNDVVASFTILYGPDDVKPLSPLVQSMYQLLKDWPPILHNLEQEMQMCLKSADPLVSNKLLCFDKFAYRSVLSFVDLLIRHRDVLKDDLFNAIPEID